MLRYGTRLAAAILTFTIGVCVVSLPRRTEIFRVEFDATAESNEVYREIIRMRITGDDRANLLVLNSETIAYPTFDKDDKNPEWRRPEAFAERMKTLWPELELETVRNYSLRNEMPEQLEIWNLNVKFVSINLADVPDDANWYRFWNKFYEKFPNSSGIVSFSKVGFNKQHDQALVYMTRARNYSDATFHYVLLKKTNGTWGIVSEGGFWIT